MGWGAAGEGEKRNNHVTRPTGLKSQCAGTPSAFPTVSVNSGEAEICPFTIRPVENRERLIWLASQFTVRP